MTFESNNQLNLNNPIPGLSLGDSNARCDVCNDRKTMCIAKNGKEIFSLCPECWSKVLHLYNFMYYHPIGIPYRNITVDLLKIINDLFKVLEIEFPRLKESKEYNLLKVNIIGKDPFTWFDGIEQRNFVFCPYCGKKLEKK